MAFLQLLAALCLAASAAPRTADPPAGPEVPNAPAQAPLLPPALPAPAAAPSAPPAAALPALPGAGPLRPVAVPATPFAQKDIMVQGMRLRYIDEGHGKPVLLIHGHTSQIGRASCRERV